MNNVMDQATLRFHSNAHADCMKANHFLVWLCVASLFLVLIAPQSIALIGLICAGVLPQNKISITWAIMTFIIVASFVNSGAQAVSLSYVAHFFSLYFVIRMAVYRLKVIDVALSFYLIVLISIVGVGIEFIFWRHGQLSELSQLSFVFNDRNYLGAYLSAGFMACLYISQLSTKPFFKAISTVFMILVPVLLLQIGSRSAVLSFVTGILCYAYVQRAQPRLVVPFAGLVLVAGFFIYSVAPSDVLANFRLFREDYSKDDSALIRLQLLLIAGHLFLDNIWFGIGPNLFIPNSGGYLTDISHELVRPMDLSSGLATHNSYVQFFAELGIVLGLIVCYKLLRLIRLVVSIVKSRPDKRKSHAVAFLFSFSAVFAVTGLFLNLHSSIPFMFVLFGMEHFMRRISTRVEI